MSPYGKIVQHAVAAMSRLAQAYGQGVRLSSADIAKSRNLPQPVVAKVLTGLSQAGLILGAPGPGGGYSLAKPPEQISLNDVAEIFERQDERLGCPFGPHWCGVGDPCPLHDQLARLREDTDRFLKSNSFAEFARQPNSGPTATGALPQPAPGPTIALPLV